MINENSSHTDINAWQQFLILQGLLPVGGADGKWGPDTDAATKTFQKNHQLNPDGKVGHDTLTAAEASGFVASSDTSFPPPGLLDVVFDISHNNASVDLSKAKQSGMMAVLHKATQSIGSTLFQDSFYKSRKVEAQREGLLWGAYHFGSGGSGKDQALAFLDFVNPRGDTLLVLDYEPNTTHGETTMSVDEAAEFVEEIYAQTGKYPGIYSGSLLKETANSGSYNSLTKCWLWKAQYGPVVHLPPGFSDYVLWQYTDGAVGPSSVPVPGTGPCDRDVFKGTADDLVLFWKNHVV